MSIIHVLLIEGLLYKAICVEMIYNGIFVEDNYLVCEFDGFVWRIFLIESLIQNLIRYTCYYFLTMVIFIRVYRMYFQVFNVLADFEMRSIVFVPRVHFDIDFFLV